MNRNAGRRLAIDFGEVRIGVAISDPSGIVASPLETIHRSENLGQAHQRLAEIINEQEVSVIYVGLPLQLSGEEGISALKARDFARDLSTYLPQEMVIRMIDERLTTSSAQKSAELIGRKLTRLEIDQYAAVTILEIALNVERSRGEIAGSPLG